MQNNDWMKGISECCRRDTPKQNTNSLNKILLIVISISILLFFLVVGFSGSNNKPETAQDIIAKKIANGEELNWLDKKVVKEWEHGK